jgi:hypothetical protein
MNSSRQIITTTAVGYNLQPGIPVEDYRDFFGVYQCQYEVIDTLRMGNYPPGLILHDGRTTAQVVGPYGEPQRLRRISR